MVSNLERRMMIANLHATPSPTSPIKKDCRVSPGPVRSQGYMTDRIMVVVSWADDWMSGRG